MFGLEDIWELKVNVYGNSETQFNRKNIFKIEEGKHSNQTWIGIFPPFVYDNEKLRKNVFPKNMKTLSYRLPKDAIRPNPKETRDVLKGVFNDIAKTIKKSNKSPSKFNILGISLGGTIAFKIANLFPINKLICVALGANLPLCIKNGIATSSIFKRGLKQGYTFNDFQRELDEFSPINNINNLSNKTKISIYLGVWDRMIPFRDGLKIVKTLITHGINPLVTKKYFYGHGFTILRFKNCKK